MSNIKKLAKDKHRGDKKPSLSKKATVNRAGGVAFEIDNPTLKLLTISLVLTKMLMPLTAPAWL